VFDGRQKQYESESKWLTELNLRRSHDITNRPGMCVDNTVTRLVNARR